MPRTKLLASFLSLSTLLLPALSSAGQGHYMQSRGEKIYSLMDTVSSTFFGGLDHRGLTIRSLGKRNYVSWPQMDLLIRKEVAADRCEDTNCIDYHQDYALTTNSNVTSAEAINLLIDGPESFAKRSELIMNAQESIYFITWAIYDDETGFQFKQELLDKLKENPQIDIKLIVDGQLSLRDSHFAVLDGLEKESEGKIEVVRWRAPLYRANGNHRKMLIVDQKDVVLGGMNIGNVYSHFAGNDFWRDTDVHMRGEIARDAYNLFAEVWNQQARDNQLENAKKALPIIELANESEASNLPRIVLNSHNPGTRSEKADRNITTGIVKLISEATDSIDIENAYLILTTPVLTAIRDAVERGVKVRILTNSGESVDEPIVSAPILQSVKLVKDAGVETYLRKGSTLHSKFMIVDKKISMIGSFNLHPRSHRYEGENMAVIFDEETARKLTETFEKDIAPASAIEVTASSEIQIEDNLLARIARTFFFDYL